MSMPCFLVLYCGQVLVVHPTKIHSEMFGVPTTYYHNSMLKVPTIRFIFSCFVPNLRGKLTDKQQINTVSVIVVDNDILHRSSTPFQQ